MYYQSVSLLLISDCSQEEAKEIHLNLGCGYVSYFPAHPPVVSKETVQVGTKLGPGRDQVTAQVTAQVLNFCQEPRKSSEIMGLIGLKHWKTFQANYLKPLLQQGLLAMTIPEKPTSSKQRYVTTEAGKKALQTWTNF